MWGGISHTSITNGNRDTVQWECNPQQHLRHFLIDPLFKHFIEKYKFVHPQACTHALTHTQNTFMCVYACVRVHLYACVCMHMCLCVCMCPCACVSVLTYACVCVHVSVHLCACVCVRACVCMSHLCLLPVILPPGAAAATAVHGLLWCTQECLGVAAAILQGGK